MLHTESLTTSFTDDNKMVINGYILLASLGRGSFAEVTLARGPQGLVVSAPSASSLPPVPAPHPIL